MTEAETPSAEEIRTYLRERRNWGRWGDDDQRGAINLITSEKRVKAARLVTTGRLVSLSRDIPKDPSSGNPRPAQHYVWTMDRGGELGGAGDYFGFAYHGYQLTHIDALSHVWGEDGMWGGRHGRDEVQPNGARWGGIEHWRDGIVTRGVLLDVPRHRGDPHVTADRPVQAAELEEIADAQGITLEPGDAVFVYSGREPFEASHPDWIPARDPHPGLASSCLRFLRENDVAVLGWDFMDAQPYEHGWAFIPHAAIQAFGVALLDNCSLEQAAAACSEAGRYEFMLSVAPLPMVGGTGSPVNPIAIF